MTNEPEPESESETYKRDASTIMLEGAERVRNIVNDEKLGGHEVMYGLDGSKYFRHDWPGEW